MTDRHTALPVGGDKARSYESKKTKGTNESCESKIEGLVSCLVALSDGTKRCDELRWTRDGGREMEHAQKESRKRILPEQCTVVAGNVSQAIPEKYIFHHGCIRHDDLGLSED